MVDSFFVLSINSTMSVSPIFDNAIEIGFHCEPLILFRNYQALSDNHYYHYYYYYYWLNQKYFCFYRLSLQRLFYNTYDKTSIITCKFILRVMVSKLD